jgi:hypothetical protein
VSLNNALVDQARVLGKAESSQRVEGTTLYVETRSPWFRARLDLGQGAGSRKAATQAKQSTRSPSIMVSVKNSIGEPVLINNQDRLEVNSKELGRSVFDVVGDPEPIRKKRRVIGWTVLVSRVDVHTTPALER